ncbi:hypothetical protein EO95_18400 [Methanosarcina sp. 1.H.T.1A.1]|uniref:universal stress protein n=1 Tax=Methanosarcina sp. 1.H.T.1A.1 TaxID=1483602 RepID=UPI00062178F5|nr:universal stress protein [Methanosarcina sp. 1.H.T.1A.1]KKH94658.1 hypothetical protein EO95_18400 [Methanosarcina sp. 1.H.T.1A.1]
MILGNKKIVVATDGSENANRAAEWAIGLAKDRGAKVFAVHVVQYTGAVGAIALKADGERATAYVAEMGKEAGVEVESVIVEDRIPAEGKSTKMSAVGKNPAESIIDIAEEKDADLIVVGTKGMTGLSHILLGSVAETVVRHSKRPVLVVR